MAAFLAAFFATRLATVLAAFLVTFLPKSRNNGRIKKLNTPAPRYRLAVLGCDAIISSFIKLACSGVSLQPLCFFCMFWYAEHPKEHIRPVYSVTTHPELG